MKFFVVLRPPRSLVLALALYLVVAGIYMWAVPPLAGFDSIHHQNYMNWLRDEQHLPRIDAEAALYSYQLVQHPPLYYLAGAALTTPWPYLQWDEHIRARENVYFGTLSDRWSIELPNAPRGVRPSVWIMRLLALVGGTLAVVGAWLWTRTVLFDTVSPRGDPRATAANLSHDSTGGMAGFGLAAVLLFALNPLFLFISTTVTNDSWAIMGAVWVMWITALLARNVHSRWTRWLALGVVAGLAALIKYNVLILLAPVGFTLILAYRHHLRRLLSGSLIAVSSALAVAGGWYFRNFMLYGELIPWTRLAQVISTIEREQAVPWRELLAQLDWLFYSYWGVFVAIFAPEDFYGFWKWFCLVCVVGLLVALGRASTASWRMRMGPALIWFLGVAAATLYWARTVSYGEQARLALIAGPALALLLSLGWRALLPARAVRPAAWLLAGIFTAVSLWPVPTLRAAYAIPQPVDPAALATASSTYQDAGATFVPGMELVGFDLPQGRVLDPHDTRPLWLYWRTTAPIQQDYTLFVHIAGADDTIWYQWDGVPAEGRHPTRQWRPGETFAMRLDITMEDALADQVDGQFAEQQMALAAARDAVQVLAGEDSADPLPDEPGVLAKLSVGFYIHDNPDARVAVENGQSGQDRAVLADLRFVPTGWTAPPPTGVPSRPLAAWENGIVLKTAHTEPDPGDGSIHLRAEWSTTTLLAENLNLFIHLVDAQGEILAQVDGPPAGGSAPTTTWLPGQILTDDYRLSLPPTPDLQAPGALYFHMGWYNVHTGERVPRAGVTDTSDYLRWPLEPQP